MTVMDDYAHHPTEVTDTVAAARERFAGRRLIACFQPHTYSRTRYLLEGFRTCFRGLDELLLAPTYAAREPESAGMDAGALALAIEAPRAVALDSLEAAAEAALGLLREGDVFFTLGAGDVDAVGLLVLDGLRERESGRTFSASAGNVRADSGLIAALAEITAEGRAAILMPYPYDKGRHQLANAEVPARNAAARILVDRVTQRLNAPARGQMLESLMSDDEERGRMASESARLGRSDAADVLAVELLAMSKVSAVTDDGECLERTRGLTR